MMEHIDRTSTPARLLSLAEMQWLDVRYSSRTLAILQNRPSQSLEHIIAEFHHTWGWHPMYETFVNFGVLLSWDCIFYLREWMFTGRDALDWVVWEDM